MADTGIRVSANEINALTADLKDLFMHTSYPFAKLDTANEVSFQNIRVTFNNDPPQPSGIASDFYRDTIIHSFKHGYLYEPNVWSLIQVIAPPPGVNFYQRIFQEWGIVGQNSIFDFASLVVKADEQNLYLIVTKHLSLDDGGIPVDLRGCTLRVRVFVFVEGNQ